MDQSFLLDHDRQEKHILRVEITQLSQARKTISKMDFKLRPCMLMICHVWYLASMVDLLSRPAEVGSPT